MVTLFCGKHYVVVGGWELNKRKSSMKSNKYGITEIIPIQLHHVWLVDKVDVRANLSSWSFSQTGTAKLPAGGVSSIS